MFPHQHSFLNNSLACSLHAHKIWKRSVEKYKSYGTLSKTTHFLSEFCEVGVVQQCTEAQAGVVQDELTALNCMSHIRMISHGNKASWMGQEWDRHTGRCVLKTMDHSYTYS